MSTGLHAVTHVPEGDLWFRQEYLCQFLATADHVFEPERIYASLSDQHQPFSIQDLYGPLGYIIPWSNDKALPGPARLPGKAPLS